MEPGSIEPSVGLWRGLWSSQLAAPVPTFVAFSVASAVYTYYVSSLVMPRCRTLGSFLLLPLATLLFCAAPMFGNYCESVLLVQSLTCLLGCCAFKVAALALCRGVLARELAAGSSMWRFMGVMLMPVIPVRSRGGSSAAQQHARRQMHSQGSGSSTSSGDSSDTNSSTSTSSSADSMEHHHLLKHSSSSNSSTDSLEVMSAQFAAMSRPRQIAIKLSNALFKLSCFTIIALSGLWAYFKVHNSSAAEAAGGSLWGTMFKPVLYYFSIVALMFEVDGMADLFDAIALAGWGIQAEPHFHMPYFSTSLGECWARRWNLTMSSLLRDLIYDPIQEMQLMASCSWGKPQQQQQQPGDAQQPVVSAQDLPATEANSVELTKAITDAAVNGAGQNGVLQHSNAAAAAPVAPSATPQAANDGEALAAALAALQDQKVAAAVSDAAKHLKLIDPSMLAPAGPADNIMSDTTSDSFSDMPAAEPVSFTDAAAHSKDNNSNIMMASSQSGDSSDNSASTATVSTLASNGAVLASTLVLSNDTQGLDTGSLITLKDLRKVVMAHSKQEEGGTNPTPAPGGRRKRRSLTHKLLGSVATFLVSGLWHELVMMHMTGGMHSSGYWTMFFLVHGVAVALEAIIKYKAKAAGIKFPRPVAVMLFTIAFTTILTAYWMPPMMRQMPNSCPVRSSPIPVHRAHLGEGPATTAAGAAAVESMHNELVSSTGGSTSSLLERIMEQALRDLEHAAKTLHKHAHKAQVHVDKLSAGAGFKPLVQATEQALRSAWSALLPAAAK